MRAVRIQAPGSAELVEMPVPEAAAGEVLVRVSAASVCATDRRMLARGAEPPRVPGHEVGGRLEDGTDVGVHPDVGCGECGQCRAGFGNRCSRRVSIGLQRDGGLAEWVAVPAGHVVPTEGIDADLVPLLEPLACCLHAVELLRVQPGDRAIVVGAGGMGILGMWALQAASARVAVVQRSADRRRAAADLGADAALGPDGDVDDALGGVSAACLVTAPGAEALGWALERVGVGGRVHAFAGTPDGAFVDANLVHYRHLTLVGSSGSTIEDYRRARDLARSGDVPLARMPRWVVSLDEAPQALGWNRPPSGLKVTVRVREEAA
jgi:threonine dehydrogenase-like Zn-dependent dehydrogenase